MELTKALESIYEDIGRFFNNGGDADDIVDIFLSSGNLRRTIAAAGGRIHYQDEEEADVVFPVENLGGYDDNES